MAEPLERVENGGEWLNREVSGGKKVKEWHGRRCCEMVPRRWCLYVDCVSLNVGRNSYKKEKGEVDVVDENL